ncbi:hypothetical protein OJAV_G00165420 [Oryzias javanicus]|uniref:C-type lectin domain-containing protein n=1 Tax=Oryzias javanicus TaxID=123683 RepID=A0A437CM03_ORYJA|nr:hypothetical protein OJAV_G00165420 [Oryzias javanicus]
MEEDMQYSVVVYKNEASAPNKNKEELTVYSFINPEKPLTSETQNKEGVGIYSEVEPKNYFPSAPPNKEGDAIYSQVEPKNFHPSAPSKMNAEPDSDIKSKETTQTAAITEVQASSRRFRFPLVCLGIICFLLCVGIIISYFTMEANKQKQNLSDLEAKNEQLSLEKRYLQKTQTKQLTTEKKIFENQTKEMTVNMTIQQKQIEQLRNDSDKLNKMKAAIIKYTNFPGDLFCPDGVCQTCPKDWIQFKESCYYFHHSNSPWKSWNESRQFCQSNKADLVVISSQEEQTFIKSRVEYYYDKWHGYWIGLRRINNNWTWVDESIDTLRYWNNPESQDNFTYIIQNANETNSWYINRNGFLSRFICEIKAFIF